MRGDVVDVFASGGGIFITMKGVSLMMEFRVESSKLEIFHPIKSFLPKSSIKTA